MITLLITLLKPKSLPAFISIVVVGLVIDILIGKQIGELLIRSAQ